RDLSGGCEKTRSLVASSGQHRLGPHREKAILDELTRQQAVGVNQAFDRLGRRRTEQIVQNRVCVESWRRSAELPYAGIRLPPPSIAGVRENRRPRGGRLGAESKGFERQGTVELRLGQIWTQNDCAVGSRQRGGPVFGAIPDPRAREVRGREIAVRRG